MSILVFNAGSSSLKFALFDDEARESLGTGAIDWAGARGSAKIHLRTASGAELNSESEIPDNRAAVSQALSSLVQSKLLSRPFKGVAAVGHRIVHGGAEFRTSIAIDEGVKAAIARLSELAPLHNPPALETLEAAFSHGAGV